MSETGRGICPQCGAELLVKTDGTLRKHTTSAGEPCPGSGATPVPVSEQPASEQIAAETTTTSGGASIRAPDEGVYQWHLVVQQPALYLDDQGWHAANAQMAGAAAAEAGHKVLAEAQCTSIAVGDDETTLVLTYTVPVEST